MISQDAMNTIVRGLIKKADLNRATFKTVKKQVLDKMDGSHDDVNSKGLNALIKNSLVTVLNEITAREEAVQRSPKGSDGYHEKNEPVLNIPNGVIEKSKGGSMNLGDKLPANTKEEDEDDGEYAPADSVNDVKVGGRKRKRSSSNEQKKKGKVEYTTDDEYPPLEGDDDFYMFQENDPVEQEPKNGKEHSEKSDSNGDADEHRTHKNSPGKRQAATPSKRATNGSQALPRERPGSSEITDKAHEDNTSTKGSKPSRKRPKSSERVNRGKNASYLEKLRKVARDIGFRAPVRFHKNATVQEKCKATLNFLRSKGVTEDDPVKLTKTVRNAHRERIERENELSWLDTRYVRISSHFSVVSLKELLTLDIFFSFQPRCGGRHERPASFSQKE